jgi:hypothetical protein
VGSRTPFIIEVVQEPVQLLIGWDALLNLDDILYYFITSHLSFQNAFQKPPDAHIRPFMLLGRPMKGDILK